jgi:hypothetical protein
MMIPDAARLATTLRFAKTRTACIFNIFVRLLAVIRSQLSLALKAIILAFERHAMRSFKMPVAAPRPNNSRFNVVALATG